MNYFKALFLTIVLYATCYSQPFEIVDIGVFAGATYSTIKGDSTGSIDGLGSRLGYKIGIEKRFFNNYKFGLELVEHGYKINDESGGNVHEAELAIKYIGIYISRIHKVNEVSLFLGPYAGYFIGADVSVEDSGPSFSRSYSKHYSISDWKDDMEGNLMDVGIIGGLAFPLTEELSISANYYFGFNDIASDFGAKNRSAQLYLIYQIY